MSMRPTVQRAPAAFAVLGIAAALYILVPVVALATRVPWGTLGEHLGTEETWELLRITLSAAALATVITTFLGTGLALWVQDLGRASGAVRLLVYLPLAMPPVVGGLALTAAVGRRGLLAPLLDALGLQFAFAFSGVVVAHIFVALPFVVVSVDSALRQLDQEIVASARGVGLGPWRVLGTIVLPAIAPSIFTGAALAFARSLGEFGTTITFAGSMPGITRTMPLGIYLAREDGPEDAYALSALLILLAIASLALAGLPGLFRRRHATRAHDVGEMDVATLRELTAPAGGGAPVTVTSAGVTTTFPANTISSVIGVNGSGKTTLMHLIAGRLTGATVSVGGRDLEGVPAHRRGIVLLTQRPGLPRTSTVAGAITMVTRDKERTAALLDAAGLTDLATVRVPDLSGGQAAQVAMVRALASRPAVLILDEPLAAVDVAAAARWRRFLHAAAGDRTTLIVTHNALDIAGLSTYAALLESGRVIAAGPTEDLLAAPPNKCVADIAGWNLLTGTVVSTTSTTAAISCGGTELTAHLSAHGLGPLQAGDAALLTFAPSAARLAFSGEVPVADHLKELGGTVIAVVAASLDDPRASVDVGSGIIEVPVDAAAAVTLAPGAAVRCLIDEESISAHARA